LILGRVTLKKYPPFHGDGVIEIPGSVSPLKIRGNIPGPGNFSQSKTQRGATFYCVKKGWFYDERAALWFWWLNHKKTMY
jgi:hypothetical protein